MCQILLFMFWKQYQISYMVNKQSVLICFSKNTFIGKYCWRHHQKVHGWHHHAFSWSFPVSAKEISSNSLKSLLWEEIFWNRQIWGRKRLRLCQFEKCIPMQPRKTHEGKMHRQCFYILKNDNKQLTRQ